MGLFSSKSKSVTNLTDNSKNIEASFGDLSSNNRIVTGNYYEQGITGQNLEELLDTVENLNISNINFADDLYGQTNKTLTDSFADMVSAVQKTSEIAITETGEAYAESKSELRNFIDAVRPIALYVAIAGIFYFVFVGGKK